MQADRLKQIKNGKLEKHLISPREPAWFHPGTIEKNYPSGLPDCLAVFGELPAANEHRTAHFNMGLSQVVHTGGTLTIILPTLAFPPPHPHPHTS